MYDSNGICFNISVLISSFNGMASISKIFVEYKKKSFLLHHQFLQIFHSFEGKKLTSHSQHSASIIPIFSTSNELNCQPTSCTLTEMNFIDLFEKVWTEETKKERTTTKLTYNKSFSVVVVAKTVCYFEGFFNSIKAVQLAIVEQHLKWFCFYKTVIIFYTQF